MKNIKIGNLYDLEHTIAKMYFKKYTYPWEILKEITNITNINFKFFFIYHPQKHMG